MNKFSTPIFSILVCFLIIWGGFIACSGTDVLAQSQSLESEPLEITTSRGTYIFEVEIADQPEERSIGLMNREKLNSRGGMLFVFDQPKNIHMWMKNTLLSLDMIFIDGKGKVVNIAEHTVPQSLDIVSSGQDASFVLELAGGMSGFIGLKAGDRFIHRLFEAEAK